LIQCYHAFASGLKLSFKAQPFFNLQKNFQEKTMHKLQQCCAAVILTVVFTLSAFAGDIGMPGATNPPPREQTYMKSKTDFSGATAEGDILSPDIAALDPVTELLLGMLQTLLPLF
jgi:hypothetical protein